MDPAELRIHVTAHKTSSSSGGGGIDGMRETYFQRPELVRLELTSSGGPVVERVGVGAGGGGGGAAVVVALQRGWMPKVEDDAEVE
jgi:hypothetical protein